MQYNYNFQFTILIIRLQCTYFQVAKLLIELDANVNEVDVLGATPLHRASAQGRSSIVELLLTHSHINMEACDSTGSTPL